MGPQKAATIFGAKHPEAAAFRVTLYGSLAATGKGHLTDCAILEVLKRIAPTDIIWQPDVFMPFHPNGMKYESLDSGGKVTDEWTVYSIGGGSLSEDKTPDIVQEKSRDIYEFSTAAEIIGWCHKTGHHIWEYAYEREDDDFEEYLQTIWGAMKAAVEAGLEEEGVLPGSLHLTRKAATYYIKANAYKPNLQSRALVFAYALAVSEHNASGGRIVTAPTCGSSGVIPAVLYHIWKSREFSEKRICHALATAGIFGNIVKTNASISGADVGCQGEVGVACAMASAAICQLFGGTPRQIEYAAEMGLEHHLGMTCDPMCGLVQIPCIERNAFAAARALDANIYATFSDGEHYVSFDSVVDAMNQTGHDIPSLYKETSLGGLAREFKE